MLSVTVARLRKVLGEAQDGRHYIESRYGRGYRFSMPIKQMAKSELPAQPHALLSTGDDSRAPFVGRSAQFERLKTAVAQVQAGFGQLCLLTGEPGIGKTHLAEHLAQYARDQGGMHVVWSRCQAQLEIPLWPVRQIMGALAKSLAGGDVNLAAELSATNNAATVAAVAERLLGAATDVASFDFEALEALAQCIIEAARCSPLLVIADDIEWADAASLQVMAYVADQLLAAPILVLSSVSDGSVAPKSPRELARLWNHRNGQRIHLPRLSYQDVTEYVRASIRRDTPVASESSTFVDLLFRRSEGNPFLLVDLLRTLSPRQRNNTQMLQFSSMALQTVRERFQALPAKTRFVVSAAAVIGRRFDVGLLSHIANCLPEEILDALVPALQTRTVCLLPGTTSTYCFDHELIRQTLYEDVPARERTELHLRAGEGLLRRCATGGDGTPAELAHHFLSAQPPGDIDQAIAYAQKAAAEAFQRGDHADALGLLDRALGTLCYLVSPKPELRSAVVSQRAMIERDLIDGAACSLALGVSLSSPARGDA